MSMYTDIKRVTIETLRKMKSEGEKITMLTAYDYTTARMIDTGGIDTILVGDSAANVMAGYETTLPITLDQMIYYAQSVVRGVKRAFVVVDLPFGTYQSDSQRALDSAIRIMKETGANAIKLEGGEEVSESISKIVKAGIPVMGHLGLTPQSINQFGSFKLRAKEEAEAEKLKKDTQLLQDLGCFSLVLEKIPSQLAKEVSQSLNIPTIGIGAGNGCDGQVLVYQDMLGVYKDFTPKFVRKFANVGEVMTEGIKAYIDAVADGSFPEEKHCFKISEEVIEKLY